MSYCWDRFGCGVIPTGRWQTTQTVTTTHGERTSSDEWRMPTSISASSPTMAMAHLFNTEDESGFDVAGPRLSPSQRDRQPQMALEMTLLYSFITTHSRIIIPHNSFTRHFYNTISLQHLLTKSRRHITPAYWHSLSLQYITSV